MWVLVQKFYTFIKDLHIRITAKFQEQLFNFSEAMRLSKELAKAGIRSNFPTIRNVMTATNLSSVLYYPSSQMTGVTIDMNCNNSHTVLKIVSKLTKCKDKRQVTRTDF